MTMLKGLPLRLLGLKAMIIGLQPSFRDPL